MLRIRGTNGKLITLPEAFQFVEITDEEGRVAALFYKDDKGAVRSVRAHDAEAANYGVMFGVKWCPVLPLPDPLKPTSPT